LISQNPSAIQLPRIAQIGVTPVEGFAPALIVSIIHSKTRS
jgi:hypothetical protein